MKQVMAKRKASELKASIPEKYVNGMKGNSKLKKCCQDFLAHDVTTYKTHDDAKLPDLMVAECKCGKKHYRVAVSPGRLG